MAHGEEGTFQLRFLEITLTVKGQRGYLFFYFQCTFSTKLRWLCSDELFVIQFVEFDMNILNSNLNKNQVMSKKGQGKRAKRGVETWSYFMQTCLSF